jgi:hypothetical protein
MPITQEQFLESHPELELEDKDTQQSYYSDFVEHYYSQFENYEN